MTGDRASCASRRRAGAGRDPGTWQPAKAAGPGPSLGQDRPPGVDIRPRDLPTEGTPRSWRPAQGAAGFPSETAEAGRSGPTLPGPGRGGRPGKLPSRSEGAATPEAERAVRRRPALPEGPPAVLARSGRRGRRGRRDIRKRGAGRWGTGRCRRLLVARGLRHLRRWKQQF